MLWSKANMNEPLVVLHKEPQDRNKSPHNLHRKIISVADLLSEPLLTIPEYQRPYKWDKSNLASLFNDIKTQCDKPAYRLGTIVLHYSEEVNRSSTEADENLNDICKPVEIIQDDTKHVEKLNIVDGQQRTLTLALIMLAIDEYYKDIKSTDAEFIKKCIGDLPERLRQFSDNQSFNSDVSVYNLYTNYQEILRIISRGDFTFEHIDFLLNRCQVVVFVLDDVSEAFQFFDSQNSRGKDLYPHDLLKAFHLREFDTLDKNLKANTVSYWEKLDDNKLAKLFESHLFRIKHWSQLRSARQFTKGQIDTFKGVNLEKNTLSPFAKALLISHHFVDDYNTSSHRYVDKQDMSYPFQLDQVTINGRRFFEMIKHYHSLTYRIKNSTIHCLSHTDSDKEPCTAFNNGENQCCSVTLCDQTLNGRASAIIHTLHTYQERNRQGDAYTRNLFDNALIYYIDKFGTENLSQAIELLFVWAYKLRLENYAVKLASMDERAKDAEGMFKALQHSVSTKAVLATNITALKITDVNENNSPAYEEMNKPENENKFKIYKLFENLNYLSQT